MIKLLRSSYRCAGFCIVVGLLFFVACSMTHEKDSASAAKISSTGDGLPKSPMTIEGSGFKSGEVVELELTMDELPMMIGKTKAEPIIASNEGTFKVTSSYPDKAILVPGMWDLRASGSMGSTAACKVVMKLE